MADRVKLAKQEKADALKEIERLQQRVADLDAYIRVHESLHPPKGEKTSRKRDAGAKAAILDKVVLMLSDGGYMKPETIVATLTQANVPIPGQNHVAYVSQLLSRDSRFTPNRKQGWSLASANRGPLSLVRGGTP